MQKEDHRRQLSLRKRTTLLWELILSPSLGADASCLPVQTDGLLEVWIIRLPEDGVRAEFVHQTAAQHGQEHFAFVVVPLNSEKMPILNVGVLISLFFRWCVLLPHCPAKFFVRHARIVLDGAPQVGQLLALNDAENAVVDVLPADHAGTVFGIVKKIADEFPQLSVASILLPPSVVGFVARRPAHTFQTARVDGDGVIGSHDLLRIGRRSVRVILVMIT